MVHNKRSSLLTASAAVLLLGFGSCSDSTTSNTTDGGTATDGGATADLSGVRSRTARPLPRMSTRRSAPPTTSWPCCRRRSAPP